MRGSKRLWVVALMMALALVAAACGGGDDEEEGTGTGGDDGEEAQEFEAGTPMADFVDAGKVTIRQNR